MIALHMVYRQFPANPAYVIGAFLTENHALQFMRECETLNKSHAKIWIENSHICTYGMAEETRRELIAAIAPILNKESK